MIVTPLIDPRKVFTQFKAGRLLEVGHSSFAGGAMFRKNTPIIAEHHEFGVRINVSQCKLFKRISHTPSVMATAEITMLNNTIGQESDSLKQDTSR
jgi:hypothetical protein